LGHEYSKHIHAAQCLPQGSESTYDAEAIYRGRSPLPELHTIRTELDDLQEKVDNITGYRKEIDHALERIAPSSNTSASVRKS
jgi:predicted component of type VI protein secretion system